MWRGFSEELERTHGRSAVAHEGRSAGGDEYWQCTKGQSIYGWRHCRIAVAHSNEHCCIGKPRGLPVPARRPLLTRSFFSAGGRSLARVIKLSVKRLSIERAESMALNNIRGGAIIRSGIRLFLITAGRKWESFYSAMLCSGWTGITSMA